MTSTGAKPKNRVAFIACGAVALDTKSLIDAHGWEADVHGISSDLHMTPHEIAPAVEEKLQALLPKYDRVIVVYGDCGTGGRLDEVLARYPAARPAGFHCFQWYAGELYQRFDDDIGIYFLTDWLVTNWDRAVIKGLGIDRFPFTKDAYFGSSACSFSSTAGAISCGVMCRSLEMPWTSASQPWASISDFVSSATAPHAMNATLAPVDVMASDPRSRRRAEPGRGEGTPRWR